ncbi:MAG TPA: VOC family protein [Puia sp.]|nr:VOC family protein [Puia sp.]
MITKLSHITFFVLDQDKAYDFYVNTLGFTVNTDAKMPNGFRWLTELRRSCLGLRRTCFATVRLGRNLRCTRLPSVSSVTFASLGYPPQQPDQEIALLPPLAGGMSYDEETRNAFKVLLEKGALGAGVERRRSCFATLRLVRNLRLRSVIHPIAGPLMPS